MRIVGQGGDSIAAQIITATGATETEGTVGIKGGAASVSGDDTTMQLASPSAGACTRPDLALTYSIPLRDISGTLAEFGWSALLRAMLWARGAPATDVGIIFGLSDGGPPTAGRPGLAGMMDYSAGKWRLNRAQNATGGGWGAWTVAAGSDVLTVGSMLCIQPTTSSSNSRWGVVALNASGTGITTSASGVEGAIGIGSSAYDYAFIGIGWILGDGSGVAASHTVSGRFAGISLLGIPDIL